MNNENGTVKIETVDHILSLFRAGIIGLVDSRILLGLSVMPAEILGLGDPPDIKPEPVAVKYQAPAPNGPVSRSEAPPRHETPVPSPMAPPPVRMASDKMQKAMWAIAQGRFPDGSKSDKARKFVYEDVTNKRTFRLEDVTFDEARDAMGRFGRKSQPAAPSYGGADDDDVHF